MRVASLNPIEGERRVGSIGQALPDQHMKTVILDGAGARVRDADTDETGTIVLAGPNIFDGDRSACPELSYAPTFQTFLLLFQVSEHGSADGLEFDDPLAAFQRSKGPT